MLPATTLAKRDGSGRTRTLGLGLLQNYAFTQSTSEGSAGWCAMIGCDSGYITAFLDENVAREMYPDIWVATAATATATGQATPVRGGYRVSGRFPFWSGCQHSEWVWVGCNVVENGSSA
jgi:indole-3-acetate monooxygenase